MQMRGLAPFQRETSAERLTLEYKQTQRAVCFKASLVTHLVRQHLLPERPTEIQRLQHRVTVAGVPELEEKKKQEVEMRDEAE